MQHLSQAYAPKGVPQAVNASTACIRTIGTLVDWGDAGLLERIWGGHFSQPHIPHCWTAWTSCLVMRRFLAMRCFLDMRVP